MAPVVALDGQSLRWQGILECEHTVFVNNANLRAVSTPLHIGHNALIPIVYHLLIPYAFV